MNKPKFIGGEILQDFYTMKMSSTELNIIQFAVRRAKEANSDFYKDHPELVKVLDEFLLIGSK